MWQKNCWIGCPGCSAGCGPKAKKYHSAPIRTQKSLKRRNLIERKGNRFKHIIRSLYCCNYFLQIDQLVAKLFGSLVHLILLTMVGVFFNRTQEIMRMMNNLEWNDDDAT